ncbi:MAG: hypothetical protein QOI92_2660, partial [Chloroflexota bacterium]|nr:hypothetical protein [Chloroflexota bacterium]
MSRALARALLACLVLVGATATSAVVLADSPLLTIVPPDGTADSLVTAKYEWIGCGGLPAGTYMVVFLWGDTKSSLAPAPFSYSGKGDCAAEATFKIPADATAGSHQVLADVEDLKGNSQPGSQTSAPFTVDAGASTLEPTKAAPAATPETTSAGAPTGNGGLATAAPPAGAGTSSSSFSAPPWVGIAVLLAVVVGGSLLAFRTVL